MLRVFGFSEDATSPDYYVSPSDFHVFDNRVKYSVLRTKEGFTYKSAYYRGKQTLKNVIGRLNVPHKEIVCRQTRRGNTEVTMGPLKFFVCVTGDLFTFSGFRGNIALTGFTLPWLVQLKHQLGLDNSCVFLRDDGNAFRAVINNYTYFYYNLDGAWVCHKVMVNDPTFAYTVDDISLVNWDTPPTVEHAVMVGKCTQSKETKSANLYFDGYNYYFANFNTSSTYPL